ncbi:MAG TPA: copper homeostasis protein CutC [Marmoricola sp.]|nr:copper homeostasis protein CutC [Marmoricola sp.]
MTIVTPEQAEPGPPSTEAALLEVVVVHPRDAAAATEGGADRLLFLRAPEEGGFSPEPSQVSAVVRETDLPVRVMLRVDDGYGITGGSFRRLVGLAADYAALGAAGLSFGFLDPDLLVDRASCAEVATEVAPLPWTFHRGFDVALEVDRAWRDVVGLPGLDAVASAGSSRGLAAGGEELIDRAAASADVARLLLVSGGLVTDQVPWLLRAGVRQFGVGASVRPGRSWTRASVDAGHVRALRMLLDDALSRALGIPVD